MQKPPDEIVAVVEENGFNVTFSGGDPIYQAEQLCHLAEKLKEAGYTIWCYTGFRFDELLQMPGSLPLLPLLDVVVDGPFIQSLRDTNLRFRGSSNQRLIDVVSSLKQGSICLWND